jgi:hypothetical protein
MPGSQRYPEARQKLFREVENGALLVSYVGHGGEVGWATERILQLEDINAWENQTTLPVFTTITCEFARFDDPNRVSAAEQLHLNPNGRCHRTFFDHKKRLRHEQHLPTQRVAQQKYAIPRPTPFRRCDTHDKEQQHQR